MHTPPPFTESSPEVLQALIAAHPLAALVVQSPQGLSADHVPLLLEPETQGLGRLRGHVARANPLCQVAASGVPVLAIFQGPEHYISPHWYATKPVHGKVVPTWNYTAVHVSGSLRCVDDPRWLMTVLQDLTAQQEHGFSPPWQVNDAPEDFLQRTLAGIVGIEITITAMVGKWKVSQNQPALNQHSVVQGLTALGTDAARAMAELVAGRRDTQGPTHP